MDDTAMLEGTQGLFDEYSFTIIPNGLSEDGLAKVRDAPNIIMNPPNARIVARANRRRARHNNFLRRLGRPHPPAARDLVHHLRDVRLPRLPPRPRPHGARREADICYGLDQH